ncbi:MAG: hypothetical protein IT196_12285 [Acidimicrobiales bacterium]|nr:hypothetical protein [Acidimicrobiales bacterium]
MGDDLETVFRTRAERAVITDDGYGVLSWHTEHRLTYATIELSVGVDGFRHLADDAALGRRVARWRDRNPQLAALLDAEEALDALAAERTGR